MNHIFAGKIISRRDLNFARFAAAELSAFRKKALSRRTMNAAVHPAPAEQRVVCGIHYCVTHSTVLAYILMICSGMANLLLWNWVYLLFGPYALQRLLYLRRHYTTIHRNTFQ